MTSQASAIGTDPAPSISDGSRVRRADCAGCRNRHWPLRLHADPATDDRGVGPYESAAGLIASANFLGYLVGALLAASPNLPGPRRVWLLGALVASALTTGAMGLAPTLAPFLVLRFIGGAASALVLIIASALVLERSAEAGRGVLSSLHFAGVGAGIAISAALVAALLHANQSWQVLWLANGALSIVATAAVAWLLPESSRTRPASRQARRQGDRSTPAAADDRLWVVRLRLCHHRDVPRRHRAGLADDPSGWSRRSGWCSAWRRYPRWRCGRDLRRGSASPPRSQWPV